MWIYCDQFNVVVFFRPDNTQIGVLHAGAQKTALPVRVLGQVLHERTQLRGGVCAVCRGRGAVDGTAHARLGERTTDVNTSETHTRTHTHTHTNSH